LRENGGGEECTGGGGEKKTMHSVDPNRCDLLEWA
jgi:hypothetical protein